jgi:hypothetical protein
MRALCGAIITAGAMVAFGLTAVGIGMRYQAHPYLNAQGQYDPVRFKHMDETLMVAMVLSFIVTCIGLGIAYVGLAYHHHRRHHEMLHTTHADRERVLTP